MPGSDYNDGEKNRQPKTNTLEGAESSEGEKEERSLREGVEKHRGVQQKEEVRKGKGEGKRGVKKAHRRVQPIESRAFGSLTTKKGDAVLGRKGGCQFKPIQASPSRNKSKHTLALVNQTGNHRTEQPPPHPPNNNPDAPPDELTTGIGAGPCVQSNSYTLNR